MLILVGMPWGEKMRSGVMPEVEKGMSSGSTRKLRMPFCICLDANLSPISGMRCSRSRVCMSLFPSSFSVIIVMSTMPFSPWLIAVELSRLMFAAMLNSSNSPRKRGGLIFPMRTSSSLTFVPVETMPSSSRSL